MAVLIPGVLLVAGAIATRRRVADRPDGVLARVATWSLGAQVATAAFVWLLLQALPEEPGGCPDSDSALGKLAVLLAWAPPFLGGPAAGAAFELANRNVWLFRALAAMLAALALSYAALAAVLWEAFCGWN